MSSKQPPSSSTPAASGAASPTSPTTRVSASKPWPRPLVGIRPEESATQAEESAVSQNQPPSLSADSRAVSPTLPTIEARGSTPWPRSPVQTNTEESAMQAQETRTNYEGGALTVSRDSPSQVAPKNAFTSDTANKEGGSSMESATTTARPTPTASNSPTPVRAAGAAASRRPPTNTDTPEDEVFVSQCASEQSSVYVTATETGGVRGLFQTLRGKFPKPGGKPGKEIPPQQGAGLVAPDSERKSDGRSQVQLPAPPTPPKPEGLIHTEGESNVQSESPNIDVVAQAMAAASYSLAELVDIAMTQGTDVLPSGSRSGRLSSPELELHRTPSKFKDWPKHEAEIIPDPASVILRNIGMGEGKDRTPSPQRVERKQSLVIKAAQLFTRKQSDSPTYWEPIFASDAKKSADPTPKDAQESQAASSGTDRSVPDRDHDLAEHTDFSSADPLENVLGGTSCLYTLESMLNIDKNLAKSSTLLPRQRSQGESPQREQFTGSMIQVLTRSASAAHTDVFVAATPRRYWILFMFCLLSMINAFQWIQYSIIASVLTDHYGVSELTISWTSMVYLIGYMILAFPSAWILDNLGLRDTVLLGAAGTAIGACIKTYAVHPGQFYIVLIGQLFPAFAQAFILGVPPRLASAWFKYEEVSTACSFGVLGNNLGIALGFVIPPNIVDAHNASTSLLYLCTAVTIVSCVCLFLLIVSFKDKPENPPSFSEMLNRASSTRVSFAKSFTTLLKDRNFLLLLGSYGLNTGAFYSISTLLNPVILVYFPGEEPFAGWLGLALIVAGLVGSWLCGMALDKTGKYKEVTLATYVLSTVGLFTYTFLLSARSHVLSIAACIFLGFFMTGYIPIGLQLAAEITYPMPEGMSSNMMNVSAQAMGFLMIFMSGYVQETFGDITSNLCLVAALLVGSMMTAWIKAELKRQEATRRESRRRSTSTISSKASRP